MRKVAVVCLVLLAASCGGSTSDGGASTGGSAGSGGNPSGGTGGSQANGGSGVGGSGVGGSGATAGSVAVSACSVPSDCVVVPVSCCGTCGAATRGDATAINARQSAEHYQQACEPGYGCDACYSPTDPNLLATCDAGQCKVVDLHASAATECGANEDCFLRTNQCCECGGSQDEGHLVAVSRHGDIEPIVCDPDSACLDCAPPPPENVIAVCSAGRCQARWYN